MRIGEMIAYQSYNVKSPLNGEAARWVSEHLDSLPLDGVSLLVEETAVPSQQPLPSAPAVAVAVPIAVPVVAEERIVACPTCSAKLRLPAGWSGPRIRCSRCQTIIPMMEA
jgi:LSD1 subclass zinc finger protein